MQTYFKWVVEQSKRFPDANIFIRTLTTINFIKKGYNILIGAHYPILELN